MLRFRDVDALLLALTAVTICRPTVRFFTAAEQDSNMPVDFRFGSPIFSFENGLPVSEFYGGFSLSSAATMLAVEHVNNQDCSIIGPGCEKLLLPGGTWLDPCCMCPKLQPHRPVA